MGGRSSSSSSSQTQTIQTDKRIAATDSATVITLDGDDNTLTDHGAIDKAGDLSLEVISKLGEVALKSLTQTEATVDVLGQSVDKTFSFVDDQSRDEDARTLSDIMPWLVAGVSILALTGAIKIR
ncbi:MAG: hypothetical protein ACRBDL_03400 [Alphaproteobacteria bacterium]